ncbi:MAG TPA: hypothetical protein DIW54_10595, partial [Chitinophagaceae bacterium]|nr:hypothetical protein [Chitinophagaceae bacterium]
MRKLLLLFAACTALTTFAQKKRVNTSGAAPVPEVTVNAEAEITSKKKFRLVGPFRGGRSAAVAGAYKSKNTFYFGGTG